jgi:hypothetical protein
MHVELQVGEAVKRELGNSPIGLDEIEKYRDGFDMLLRLTGNIAKVSQLQRKFAKLPETKA